MELNYKKIGNAIIIYLEGRMDVHLSADIEKGLNKLIDTETACNFILNLSDVEYMSSSGLRIFVSTMRILKETKRKLVISNMNNSVRKIFEVVELTDMFDIFGTENEALEYLKKYNER